MNESPSLPQKPFNPPTAQRWLCIPSCVMLATIFFCSYTTYYQRHEQSQLKQKIAAIDNKLSAHYVAQQSASPATDHAQSTVRKPYQTWPSSATMNPGYWLELFAATIPSEARLDTYVLEKNTIVLEGTARTSKAIHGFFNALSAHEKFDEAFIASIKPHPFEKSLLYFMIKIHFL